MKILKISGYALAPNYEYVDAYKTYLIKDMCTRQLHIEESREFEGRLSDFAANCDLTDLEQHFEHDSSIGEYGRKLPQPGEVWKHFKGNEVEIVGISQDTEWNTYSVVYRYDDRLFNRPLDMFMSKVDREKYPDAKQVCRFECVSV